MKDKKWWESKKTWDMVFGVFALLVAAKLNVSPDVMAMVSGIVGVKIVGQSAVDFKKK